jgi:S1-C subfamily serine protease
VEAEIIRDGKTMLLKVTLLDSAPQVSMEEKNSDRFLSALGIEIRDAKADFLERMGYERGAAGALVSAVERNSPADQLGFRAGSLVTGFNGKDIRSAQEMRNAIGAAGQVNVYEITWRDGSLVRKAKLTVN